MKPKPTFTIEEALAGICVFEWLMDLRVRFDRTAIQEQRPEHQLIVMLFEDQGWSHMRYVALQVGLVCEEAWDIVDAKHEALFADWSYDWDFVPAVCALIHWSKMSANMSHRDIKQYKPDPEGIVATIIAQRALRIGRKVA